MTIGEFVNSRDVGNAHAGRYDALDGIYSPPRHYGTQMSAGIRAVYILAYLQAGGDSSKLSDMDWYHVGLQAKDYGMPDHIRESEERHRRHQAAIGTVATPIVRQRTVLSPVVP